MTAASSSGPGLRVGFAGTPSFARQALQAVCDAGFTVPLVLTQPDRPAGRGLRLQASLVKQWAVAAGLTVAQPRSLRLDGRYADDAQEAHAVLQAADLDVLVVAAYGLILPEWVLAVPRRGCLNIHASMLPRWRGAAPIQRAIEAGDPQTGITLMQMDAGLDTGPMLMSEATDIGAEDTAATLHDRLADIGSRLVVHALQRLRAGGLTAEPQPKDGATYARKIDKAEGAIDWQAPAAEIERRLRAFDPFPGATVVVGGQAVKLWRGRVAAAVFPDRPVDVAEAATATATTATAVAAVPPGAISAAPPPAGDAPGQLRQAAGRLFIGCGDGWLELLELQLAGGKRLGAREFLQRHPGLAG